MDRTLGNQTHKRALHRGTLWPCFPAFPSPLVKWLSVGMCAQVPCLVAVAFLVVWVEPGQQPVLHLPKQLCPMT